MEKCIQRASQEARQESGKAGNHTHHQRIAQGDRRAGQAENKEEISMTTRYIYGLADPFTYQIRYIGQTNNLQRRYKEHLEDCSDTKKSIWIRYLKSRGVVPGLVHLDTCTVADVDALEEWWIKLYVAKQWPLTNTIFAGVRTKRRWLSRADVVTLLQGAGATLFVLILIYMFWS